jgi:hypothetical protein
MQPNDVSSGTSDELTVETAAPVFESYLSSLEDEDQAEPEATPAQESTESEPESEEEARTEPAEEDEGTETAQTDEESEESPEAPAELTYDPAALVRVKVDGVEQQVTLEEALKGYSRTADYTRKTQAHSEKVKAFEQESQAVRNERQLYAQRLAQLDQHIADMTPQEPDWDQVQKDRPAEFANLRAQWSLFKERQAAIQAERQRAEEAVQRDMTVARQQYLQAEQEKLFEALPEWKDTEKASKAKADMVAYVKDLGYSVEEISGITDHRIIKILDKAMKWDRAQEKKPVIAKRIEKVKTATPGPSKGKPVEVSKAAQARQRLAKTGRTEDAAAAFEELLNLE